MTVTVGVVVFPGTNCELDVIEAARAWAKPENASRK